MFSRHFSLLDRVFIEIERALSISLGAPVEAQRSSPAAALRHEELTPADQQHAAGLMRINHTGEICAQALYSGQAAVARNPQTQAHLQHAASEEIDHLAWCAERLHELQSRPSLLNPVWYLGSFAIGVLSGLASDAVSFGFVVETERQVEAHLGEHLRILPEHDNRSRAIVEQMQAEEAKHGQAALQAGAQELPSPIPWLMRCAAQVMKTTAYRI